MVVPIPGELVSCGRYSVKKSLSQISGVSPCLAGVTFMSAMIASLSLWGSCWERDGTPGKRPGDESTPR